MSTDPHHGEASDLPGDGNPAADGQQPDAGADQSPSAGPLPDPPATTDSPQTASSPGEATDSGAEARTMPTDPAPSGAETYTGEPAVSPGPVPGPTSPAATSPDEPAPGTDAEPAPVDVDSPAVEPPLADGPGAEMADPGPTAAEDAALREERARRFGRFGSSGPQDPDPQQDPQVRTTALPATAEPAPATTPLPSSGAVVDQTTPQPVATTPEPAPTVDDDDPFEDWDEPPRSRAQAHWWVVLITLVFIPPAWYLLADGGERWSNFRDASPDAIHVGALLEIAGGLILLAAVLIGARWSSVGPIIIGSIATLIGGAFLAIPQMVEDFLAEYSEVFTRLGQFGQNVYDHLLMDGNAGRILAYGVVLIFAGVISHGARRQGRREERRRAAIEAL